VERPLGFCNIAADSAEFSIGEYPGIDEACAGPAPPSLTPLPLNDLNCTTH
jgi:hypothetical protein